ncbi:MAG: ABC transporter substrate-binding protein, partial [Firmicutes bacterium]|nr:ABC transporter substrate-binding protein [Bacillota bacterium]
MARKGFWKLALVCFLVLALALTVGACKKKEEPKTQPTPGQTEQPKKEEPKKEEPKKEAPKEPLKIGYMGPITGNWSAYGTNHLNAAILAADEWNKKGGLLGRQIEIVQADSQADPQQAAVLANKLVDQKVAAVIGPTFSLEAEVTVPVFKANNMVSVTGLADLMDPKGSEGYFRV